MNIEYESVKEHLLRIWIDPLNLEIVKCAHMQ